VLAERTAVRSVVRLCALVVAAGVLAAVTPLPATGSIVATTARRHKCTAGTTYKTVTPTGPRTLVVNVRRANVRRRPGTDCRRVASVKRRTRLNATGARAKASGVVWLEVDGTFGRAWIAASLVR
jgi:hypothetical protein